jgi:hypothetical protein
MNAWNWICISPCIISVVALALFIGYALLQDVYGEIGAKLVWRHELFQLLVSILLMIGISPALEAVSKQQFEVLIVGALTLSSLAVAIDALNVRRRSRTSQAVLLKCDERKKPALIGLAIMILLGVAVVMALFVLTPQADSTYRATVVLLGVLIALVGLNVYYRTRQPLIATTAGLIAGARIYRWDGIRLYYIAPPQRSAPLILRLKPWSTLTDTIIIPLRLEEIDRVSTLLAEQLPGLRVTEQPASSGGETATKLA